MPTGPGSSGSPGGHSRRSNLFVVRIWRVQRAWREDVGVTLSSTGSTEGEDDGSNGRAWQWEGRIQRAVSGEEHHFQGWPGLIEMLEEMLYDAQPLSGRDHAANTKKRDGKPSAGERADRKCEKRK